MTADYYTLAAWHVKDGKQQEFMRIWREELAAVFLSVDPDATGTLIQSLEDPRRFYSFGPWQSLEHMQAARSDPRAGAVLARLFELCEEATPGAYRVVLTVP